MGGKGTHSLTVGKEVWEACSERDQETQDFGIANILNCPRGIRPRLSFGLLYHGEGLLDDKRQGKAIEKIGRNQDLESGDRGTGEGWDELGKAQADICILGFNHRTVLPRSVLMREKMSGTGERNRLHLRGLCQAGVGLADRWKH